MGRRMIWRPGKLALLRRAEEARRDQPAPPPAKRIRHVFNSEFDRDDSGPEPADDDWEDNFGTDGLAVSSEKPSVYNVQAVVLLLSWNAN